jgi:hypothetical protein
MNGIINVTIGLIINKINILSMNIFLEIKEDFYYLVSKGKGKKDA